VYAEGIVKCGGGRVWVSLGGVGCIQFYEGVKVFVGKDGMVIVEVGASCMYDVYVEPLNGV
jgi:hypothetical protein